MASAISQIPFLGAYLEQEAANRARPMQELQQASGALQFMGALQQQQQQAAMRDAMAQAGGDVEKALEAALKTGNVAAAHQLAPLVKLRQEAAMRQAVVGADMNDPETLRKLGIALNKPEYITHAERLEQKARDAATMGAMRSSPEIRPDPQELQQAADQGTTPPDTKPAQTGTFEFLYNSEAPGLAAHAKQLQKQLDSGFARDNPGYWEKARDALAARETAYQASKQRQQISIDNRNPAPAFSNIQPDGKGGFIGLSRDSGQIEQVPMKGVSAPTSLSEDALQNAAWEKLLFGKEPTGMGNANAAQKAQVKNAHAQLVTKLGLSPMEAAMLPNDNKIKMKAVDKLTTWGATVARSAEKLDLDLQVAIDYAKKLPLGQIQLINRGIIAGKKEFNDPNANAYAAALNSVRQEYARLMTGPTSNAMLPVEAMKKGNELLSMGVDVASLEEVGLQMRRDAANTITATNNQVEGLRNSIRGLGREPTLAPRGPSLPSQDAIDAEIARRKKK